jgi:hypothetical protein
MPTTYAIPDGRVAMAATLYTGTGGTVNVNNAVNGVSFQPDFVWIKNRGYPQSNTLYDSIRGVYNVLVSNSTVAEDAETANHGLSAFASNGFTLIGETVNQGGVNTSPYNYVGWQWKAGGTAVSNTAGSITSSVSANTTAGFSVVTYTGNGTAGATIGHGLGVAPSMVIVKVRNAVNDWCVYHVGQAAANASGLYLNLTNVSVAVGWWNSTTPTSTVFTLGSNAIVNNTGSPFVAYCFAPVAGYSAFGSYAGNSSTDGPFIYTGFKPRFIMIKAATRINSWHMTDTSRSTYNTALETVWANESTAESTSAANAIDVLSNGFKLRYSTGEMNNSGDTYIYACFAENPFKYANAR